MTPTTRLDNNESTSVHRATSQTDTAWEFETFCVNSGPCTFERRHRVVATLFPVSSASKYRHSIFPTTHKRNYTHGLLLCQLAITIIILLTLIIDNQRNNNMGKHTDAGSFVSLASASALMELEKYDDMTSGCDHADDTTSTTTTTSSSIVRKSWFELQRISLLGRGVYSNVHLVIEPKTHKQYALKCLDASRINDSEEFLDAASDLAREASLLARLDHENIIQLRGLCASSISDSYQEDGNGFFFLMDVLDETLKDRMDRWRSDGSLFHGPRRFLFGGAKTVDVHKMRGRIETVALGIVRGMRYLHEQQSIVLRDLKPANIGFEAETGRVKLFDFGMSRHIDECLPEDVVGTPRYMAPEVMLSHGTSYSSDVYSFGVVLYEICSLKVAFAKQRNLDDFQRHVVDAKARPNLACIPCARLQALIADCWAHEPSARPSFAEIDGRLVDILTPSIEKPVLPSAPRQVEYKRSSSILTRRTYRMDPAESIADDDSNRTGTVKISAEEFSALDSPGI